MHKRIPGDIDAARSRRAQAPSHPPRGLERLATACLKAEAEDSRLGDLFEQYGRTHECARRFLGEVPLAMTLSHLVADIRYVFSAANVILFARTVDSRPRLDEPGAKEAIAVDLKERTMIMLSSAAKKLVLPALLLVGGAFLINGAVNVWSTWREAEALQIGLQREKAEAAAAQIHQYLAGLQDQMGWATDKRAVDSADDRRAEYLRLLRKVPAITEIARLNGEGREVLRVSRLARDTVDSRTDFSGDARFTDKRNVHVSPLYFNKQSDPHVSIVLRDIGLDPGVTMAEVNIKRLWDIIGGIKVGETGYAYVVDGKGRMIAGRDKDAALRQSDLSNLPQVVAALAAAPSGAPGEGRTFDTSPTGAAVLSVHAALPALGWKVFVELPMAEARAPLWTALARAACLMGLGILAVFLASVAAARRNLPAQPVRT